MARFSQVLIFALNGLLLTTAVPQYGAPAGGADSGAAQPPAPPPPGYPAAGGAGGAPSYGGAPAGQAPVAPPAGGAGGAPSYGGAGGAPSYGGAGAGGESSGGSVGGSSSGSGGGDLSVQCKAAPDGSGKIKYDCSGVNKDAITLKTEHFLWLESPSSASQNLDIEIPNYNIDEFIKAAYKALGPQEGAKINILLKKPDVTYNAEKTDAPKADQSQPAVSVNYQPVDKISVHYPTQKAYGSNSGPAPLPPASVGSGPGPAAPAGPGPAPGGGGAYSRPQRESGYKYYFVRQ